MTASRRTRLTVALCAALTVAAVATAPVFAGEVTGNGTIKTVHGRSECAYSGQEDLQFFYDDADTMPKPVPTRGDPGHAQSWGQIDKATRDFLATLGLHPGTACNPNKSAGEP